MALIHFSDQPFIFDYINTQRFLTAYNHFQVNNKSISYYISSNDFLDKFQISIENSYKCLSLQPQLIKNQLTTIVTLPLSSAQKRDNVPQKMLLCAYSNDPEIYSELTQRIMENSSCQNNKLEHLYFCQDVDIPKKKPINTLVYTIYILLNLIQNKLPPKILKLQLERITYSVMVQLVETELSKVCNTTTTLTPQKKAKN